MLYLTILLLHFFTDFSQSDHSFIFKNELYVLSKEGLFRYESDPRPDGDPLKSLTPIVNNFKKIYDIDFSLLPRERFHVEVLKDQIFLIDRKGGLVYRVDNGNLVRIDNSFAHRNQSGSKIFQINDTIYKYGGYGYWQIQDLITYYDFTSNEWEIIEVNGKEIRGLVDSYSIEHNNIIYFFGGTTVDKKKRKKVLKNYNIYSFDFKTRKWDLHGRMKYNFNSLANINISLNKKEHIIYRNDSIFHLNLLENKMKIYKTNSFHDRLVKGKNLKTIYIDSAFHAFNIYPHDHHFSLSDRESSPKKNLINAIEFQKVDYDVFLQTPISEEPILLNSSYEKYFKPLFTEESPIPKNYRPFFRISILLFVIYGIIFSLFISSTRLKRSNSANKIFLDSLILKYGNDSMQLNQIEQQILLLLSQKIKITGNEIKEMFDQNLNYSHIMRSKKQTIDNLNFKLKTLTKSEENLITIVTSSIDKRIKEYTLIEKFQIISDKSSV